MKTEDPIHRRSIRIEGRLRSGAMQATLSQTAGRYSFLEAIKDTNPKVLETLSDLYDRHKFNDAVDAIEIPPSSAAEVETWKCATLRRAAEEVLCSVRRLESRLESFSKANQLVADVQA